MTDAERAQFSTLILACGEIYNRFLSEVSFELFWKLLRPWPLKDVALAVEAHMRASQYMPTPHDILARLEGGAAEDLAAATWPIVKWLLAEPMMSDMKTLLPDGAAAMAANDLVKARLPKDQIPYCYEFYKLAYARHYEKGAHRTPLVFEWPRTVDEDGRAERRQTPVLFNDFWPPAMIRKHREALERFKPGNPLSRRLEAEA